MTPQLVGMRHGKKPPPRNGVGGGASRIALMTMRHVENKKCVIWIASKKSNFVRSIRELVTRKFKATCPKTAQL